MKQFIHALMAFGIMLFATTNVPAQVAKTIEFKVTGNCGMCKKTIESSLKGQPGITSAEWNKDSKMIKVAYDPAKISEDEIHQKIADVGYDTEKKKASDKAYEALPGCCQYERTIHSKNKDHENKNNIYDNNSFLRNRIVHRLQRESA